MHSFSVCYVIACTHADPSNVGFASPPCPPRKQTRISHPHTGHGYPIPESTVVPKAKKQGIFNGLTSVFTKRNVATAAVATAAVKVGVLFCACCVMRGILVSARVLLSRKLQCSYSRDLDAPTFSTFLLLLVGRVHDTLGHSIALLPCASASHSADHRSSPPQ